MNTTPANDLPRKAAAIPSLYRPQFKLRTLTLAVLSALPVLTHAAGNVASAPVNPLPTGGTVLVPGSASIVNSAPNLLTINQSAARATINWNSFDIAQGNTVRFNQPSASAEALNYIGGANPSLIQGTLSANGKVYLVNANGIVFDRSAQVNVNTLIASSLNISQSSFDNCLLSSLTGQPAPTLVATMLLNKAAWSSTTARSTACRSTAQRARCRPTRRASRLRRAARSCCLRRRSKTRASSAPTTAR
jgi:filamentous haemagglutinin family N-terminal domain